MIGRPLIGMIGRPDSGMRVRLARRKFFIRCRPKLCTMSAMSENKTATLLAGVAVGALAGVLAVASYVVLTDNAGHISRSLGHPPSVFEYDSLFGLAMAMTTSVAYAVILLLFGRSGRRRLGGAALALFAGLSRWWLLVTTIYPAQHFPMARNYALFIVPVTFATLAWGVARRHSTRWLWAVPLAPLLMGVEVWLWWHTEWFVEFQGSHGMRLINALNLGPIVLASVAGWLLDASPRGASPVPDTADDQVPSPV